MSGAAGSTGTGVTEVVSSVNAGSTEDLMMDLAQGSYYVAVVDYAGVAMRYSMCIRGIPFLAAIRSCGLILPGPPALARSKPRLSPFGSAGVGARHPSLFVPNRRP